MICICGWQFRVIQKTLSYWAGNCSYFFLLFVRPEEIINEYNRISSMVPTCFTLLMFECSTEKSSLFMCHWWDPKIVTLSVCVPQCLSLQKKKKKKQNAIASIGESRISSFCEISTIASSNWRCLIPKSTRFFFSSSLLSYADKVIEILKERMPVLLIE